MAGLNAAKERGRLGRRPRTPSADDLAAAKALLRDPHITVEQVVERLNIAPSTRLLCRPVLPDAN